MTVPDHDRVSDARLSELIEALLISFGQHGDDTQAYDLLCVVMELQERRRLERSSA